MALELYCCVTGALDGPLHAVLHPTCKLADSLHRLGVHQEDAALHGALLRHVQRAHALWEVADGPGIHPKGKGFDELEGAVLVARACQAALSRKYKYCPRELTHANDPWRSLLQAIHNQGASCVVRLLHT
eukprot:scaffold102618_cov21-Tisochrysis_lutea.AAC.1